MVHWRTLGHHDSNIRMQLLARHCKFHLNAQFEVLRICFLLPSHSQTRVFFFSVEICVHLKRSVQAVQIRPFSNLEAWAPWCMKKAVWMNLDHLKEAVWFLSFFSALALKLEPYQLQGKFVTFSMHHSFECRLMFDIFFLILTLKSWALAVLWQMYVSTWTISGRLRADSISLAVLSSSLVLSSNFLGSFCLHGPTAWSLTLPPHMGGLVQDFIFFYSLHGTPSWPEWSSTIHWMPITPQLWMNLNWVNIWFHLGNPFYKK